LKVIDIIDLELEPDAHAHQRLGAFDYEGLLGRSDPDFSWQLPDDEWNAISLSYTSGTSGRPKGVVYHHRNSYLMALGTIAGWELPSHPRYLYSVPMFQCNGWGHAWTMAAAAGTIIARVLLRLKPFF